MKQRRSKEDNKATHKRRRRSASWLETNGKSALAGAVESCRGAGGGEEGQMSGGVGGLAAEAGGESLVLATESG